MVANGRMRTLTLMTLTVIGLTGCDTLGVTPDSGPPCPAVAIIGDAAKLTRFAAGPGRDVTDVDYRVELTGIGGECRHNNAKKPTQVVVEMRVFLSAKAGPANQSGRADFRYFAAVIDRDNTILAREEFAYPVALGGVGGSFVGEDRLEQTIPLPDGASSSSYQVLIGILMTPEELSRNRAGLNR